MSFSLLCPLVVRVQRLMARSRSTSRSGRNKNPISALESVFTREPAWRGWGAPPKYDNRTPKPLNFAATRKIILVMLITCFVWYQHIWRRGGSHRRPLLKRRSPQFVYFREVWVICGHPIFFNPPPPPTVMFRYIKLLLFRNIPPPCAVPEITKGGKSDVWKLKLWNKHARCIQNKYYLGPEAGVTSCRSCKE